MTFIRKSVPFWAVATVAALFAMVQAAMLVELRQLYAEVHKEDSVPFEQLQIMLCEAPADNLLYDYSSDRGISAKFCVSGKAMMRYAQDPQCWDGRSPMFGPAPVCDRKIVPVERR